MKWPPIHAHQVISHLSGGGGLQYLLQLLEVCVLRRLGLLTFVSSLLHSTFTLLHAFCFLLLFHTCCSHALVFGKTLVHELHISYIPSESNLLSSLSETAIRSGRIVLLNKTLN